MSKELISQSMIEHEKSKSQCRYNEHVDLLFFGPDKVFTEKSNKYTKDERDYSLRTEPIYQEDKLLVLLGDLEFKCKANVFFCNLRRGRRLMESFFDSKSFSDKFNINVVTIRKIIAFLYDIPMYKLDFSNKINPLKTYLSEKNFWYLLQEADFKSRFENTLCYEGGILPHELFTEGLVIEFLEKGGLKI